MDMHMPVMDGLEASSKIMELNTGVPIVAMTANIMANDLEVYKMSGMHDCVGKPFTSQELWRTLMKYMTPVSIVQTHKEVQLEADLEFQKSLQLLFVKNNKNKYQEIVKALDEGDIQLAHRLSHTLKSNSGQIGKILLQKAAADVEYQLKDGTNNTTEEKLKQLQAELNMVMNDFSALYSEESHIDDEDGLFPRELPPGALELLDKLEPLLKGGNPECVEYIDELIKIPGCGQLVQQIEDFDFDNAATTLSIIRKRIN